MRNNAGLKIATKPEIVHISSVLTAILFLMAFPSPAKQSTFGADVQRIAHDIEAQRKTFLFPKVLVIDFPVFSTGVENISSYLADVLSHSLESRLPAGDLIPRAELHDFLFAHQLSPLDLVSVPLASWAADQLGANEIIYGEIIPGEDALKLNLKLVRLGDAKEVANWILSISFTDQLKAQNAKQPDWHFPPDVREFALRCASDRQENDLKAFAKRGGVRPKAIFAPNPAYSEEARKEKLQEVRSYDVFIDEKGRPLLVVPERPVRPEFDDIALKTLADWQFQPATMMGKPVAVCIIVGVNWKLY